MKAAGEGEGEAEGEVRGEGFLHALARLRARGWVKKIRVCV